MKLTKKQSLQVIESLIIGFEFENQWIDFIDKLDLYDEENNDCPSIYDIMEPFGISKDDYLKILKS
jgi:hypothetical protein